MVLYGRDKAKKKHLVLQFPTSVASRQNRIAYPFGLHVAFLRFSEVQRKSMLNLGFYFVLPFYQIYQLADILVDMFSFFYVFFFLYIYIVLREKREKFLAVVWLFFFVFVGAFLVLVWCGCFLFQLSQLLLLIMLIAFATFSLQFFLFVCGNAKNLNSISSICKEKKKKKKQQRYFIIVLASFFFCRSCLFDVCKWFFLGVITSGSLIASWRKQLLDNISQLVRDIFSNNLVKYLKNEK